MKILSQNTKKIFIVLISAICIISMSSFSLFSKSKANAKESNETTWNPDRHMYTPDKHQRGALRIDQNLWDTIYQKIWEYHQTKSENFDDIDQVRYVAQKNHDNDLYVATGQGKRDDFIYTGEGPYISSDNDYCTDIAPYIAVHKKVGVFFGVDFLTHSDVNDYNYCRFSLEFYGDDGNYWIMTHEMYPSLSEENSTHITVPGLNNDVIHYNCALFKEDTNTDVLETWYAIQSSYHKGGKEYKDDNNCPIFWSNDGKTLNCSDEDFAPFIGKTGWLYIKYVFDED